MQLDACANQVFGRNYGAPVLALTEEEALANAKFTWPVLTAREWHATDDAVQFVWSLTGASQWIDREKLVLAQWEDELAVPHDSAS